MGIPRRVTLVSAPVLCLLLSTVVVAGLTPEEVLLVVNDSSDLSTAIGDYYAALRGIPLENVVHLPAGTSTAETVDRTTYNVQIRDVLRDYLRVQNPHLEQQILCIVTTKGVPLRVNGPSGAQAAVDSELTQLFTDLVGDSGQAGSLTNRYFGNHVAFRRFRDELGHADDISYLVTRLTGYQTDVDPFTGVPRDILDLMDRSVAVPDPGVFLLDKDPTKTGGYLIGNIWMDDAKAALVDLGETTVLDASNTFVSNQADIVGYASWGSNDCCDPGPPYYGEVPAGSGDVYPGFFLPRSICTTYVSTSGRTFTDGNQNYGQSLVADLVHQGACAAGGHVYEPYLSAVPQPQELLVAYARGFSVAEAYYQGIVALSWMNVIVADPLMTFRDFDGPTILAVEPAGGSVVGGEPVVLTGLEFRDDVEVLFGGVPATEIVWIDLGTLEAVTPPVPVVGPVDVTVLNAFGSDTLAGGFAYEPQPVDLHILGEAHVGEPVTFRVTGPPLRPYALLADTQRGEKCFKGGTVCFELAFSNRWKRVHDSIQGSDAPLDEYGDGLVTVPIPDNPALADRFFWFQGVVRRVDGFEVTPLRGLYVFP
jgi:uncharacterized protein (TIGR03790 family)